MKKAAIIVRLCEGGFKVRGIVTDNHFNNVNAFKILLSENDGDKQHLFVATGSETKTFMFYDSVHLIKKHKEQFTRLREICVSTVRV